MQLLFRILTSLKAYKNLNLLSVLHVAIGSVSNDWMMHIVTCYTPWTYPHFLKGKKKLDVSFVQGCHWLPKCTPSVQALHKSLHQTHTSSHPLQHQICTNTLFLLFLLCLAIWNSLHILLCHLVCSRVVCISIIWVHYIISFCYLMYPLCIMHKISKKNVFKH